MRHLVFALLLAAACRAEEACPWINGATAAGVLGGDVRLDKSDTVCIFTHDSSQLRIEVETVSLPYKVKCEPSPTPLKGIGNEAAACSPEEKNGAVAEQVAGRVRDHAFIVRISTIDRSIARATLRDKTRLIAEQVAGILF
jgi:hypothetical protein